MIAVHWNRIALENYFFVRSYYAFNQHEDCSENGSKIVFINVTFAVYERYGIMKNIFSLNSEAATSSILSKICS